MTEVQTCALPIWQPVPQAAAERARAAARPPDDVAAPISSSAAAIHAAECPGDIAGRRLHRIPAQQHGPVALLRCGGVQRRHIVLREGEGDVRSEEHTSELQSLMRISYAVFCLKKKTTKLTYHKLI